MDPTDEPNPETVSRLIAALEGDYEGIMHTITVGATALGISRQQAAERFLEGVLNQRHEAMEVLSDPDLPSEAIRLGERITAEAGQRVTGIKRAESGGFAYITPGNPIMIEGWARRAGYAAYATGPTTCVIVDLNPNR